MRISQKCLREKKFQNNHFKYYGCLEIIYISQRKSDAEARLKLERWNINELGLCDPVFLLSFQCRLEVEMEAFEALLILNYCQPYFSLFSFINFALQIRLENCLLPEHNHPLMQSCFWFCSSELLWHRKFSFLC